MLQTERMIDRALKCDFDHDACESLATCIFELQELLVEPGRDLPILIPDDSGLVSNILIAIDVAYCCWRNDGAVIELPGDVAMNHIARMKLNPQHCKAVLDFTRLFLRKYDRLLSVESAMLRV